MEKTNYKLLLCKLTKEEVLHECLLGIHPLKLEEAILKAMQIYADKQNRELGTRNRALVHSLLEISRGRKNSSAVIIAKNCLKSHS